MTTAEVKRLVGRGWDVRRDRTQDPNLWVAESSGCFGHAELSHEDPALLAAACHAWEAVWYSGVRIDVSAERRD